MELLWNSSANPAFSLHGFQSSQYVKERQGDVGLGSVGRGSLSSVSTSSKHHVVIGIVWAGVRSIQGDQEERSGGKIGVIG